jgi:hypothetical protein
MAVAKPVYSAVLPKSLARVVLAGNELGDRLAGVVKAVDEAQKSKKDPATTGVAVDLTADDMETYTTLLSYCDEIETAIEKIKRGMIATLTAGGKVDGPVRAVVETQEKISPSWKDEFFALREQYEQLQAKREKRLPKIEPEEWEKVVRSKYKSTTSRSLKIIRVD